MTDARYFWGSVNRPCYHDPSAKIERELFFCSNFAAAKLDLDI